ncbi:apoptosis-inducing factor-like [Heracleum sosnowskyi]|uniref:Apoptosis-inducing factor-like n=1 Tax=Heracleum sosnowskyi TaxID=360622 RepID=A0AAD8J413_9APIA|nr:apoptosis-inducing factor-like [Heracleum sosnowskyi]
MAANQDSVLAKRVVVIGGGVAGSVIAKSLQFTSHLTLIDPKEYFEIPWADLRAMVEPSFAERSVIYHKDYLTNGNIVTSKAIDVKQNQVVTADGRSIAYDYLVIASGHSDPYPKTRTERLKQFHSDYEKIKSSQSILIVGGGPTGVELAGEIANDFPQKKVTLVHNGSRLLEMLGPKAAKKTLDWLISKRVDVKFNQKVNLSNLAQGSKEYSTSSGQIIKADSHFLCIGKPLASEWLKETALGNSVDESGRLMVDANLRIKGCKNIFAIGDITDLKEMKQGYLAQEHSAVVAKNIKILISGGSEDKMSTYKPTSKAIAIVTLGRKNAVAQFPFLTLSGFLPTSIKSKDLFVGKTRKLMGLH